MSDINEAAINNDRTVTAATKVNGKGLSSTMGDIHLNPSSVNTNRGGTINFHYNQASSTTSAIYENASGQVRIDGNLYLNGNTTNGFKVKGGSLEAYTHTDTTANQTRDIIVYGPDGTSRISTIRNNYYTNGNKELEIFVSQDVDGSRVFNSLRMTNDTEGNRRCFLNYSPATTSNSTDVATTAYTRAYTSETYLPLNCSSPITGTIWKNTAHVRGGTDVYAATDTIPLGVRDANGKNWFRLITSQRYTSSSDFSSSVGFYLYHPTNASQNANVANIAVGYNQDGPYTAAPTPPTSSNDTNIATTAFVNNRLPYETGTWTPVIAGATTAGAFTYTNQKGYYIKIGKLVFIYAQIVTSAYTTHPEGRFRVNGLPFTSKNSTYAELTAMGYSGGVSNCIKRIRLAIIPPNTSRIEIEVVNSTDLEEIMYANFSTSSATGLNIQFSSSAKALNMYISGCYEAS